PSDHARRPSRYARRPAGYARRLSGYRRRAAGGVWGGVLWLTVMGRAWRVGGWNGYGWLVPELAKEPGKCRPPPSFSTLRSCRWARTPPLSTGLLPTRASRLSRRPG